MVLANVRPKGQPSCKKAMRISRESQQLVQQVSGKPKQHGKSVASTRDSEISLVVEQPRQWSSRDAWNAQFYATSCTRILKMRNATHASRLCSAVDSVLYWQSVESVCCSAFSSDPAGKLMTFVSRWFRCPTTFRKQSRLFTITEGGRDWLIGL